MPQSAFKVGMYALAAILRILSIPIFPKKVLSKKMKFEHEVGKVAAIVNCALVDITQKIISIGENEISQGLCLGSFVGCSPTYH